MERLGFTEVSELAARAFKRAGVPDNEACHAAEILTLAEAMEIATHGLSRVKVYIDRITAGGIDPKAVSAVSSPAPALRLVDGGNGLGPAVADTARRAAADAARNCGIGAAFVKRGNHLGALAPYLYLAAEAGFAAILTTTTAPMIAPAGGREARIGNNPLGIGIPCPKGDHIILDMALSVVSRSRVRAAAKEGIAIPGSWATDSHGHPTTDPTQAMQGLMQAIGGDKGAHLALCLDLMITSLSGAATLTEIPTASESPETPQDIGHAIILVDADAMLSDVKRTERLEAASKIVAATHPAKPNGRVRLPGERALSSLSEARTSGLKIGNALLKELHELAGS